MDAANAFETQDLQLADLVEREGRALVFCIAKWDLVETPQTTLAELRETAERQLPQVRGTPLVTLSGGDRSRRRQADAGGVKGARQLVGEGQDPRPQRLARHGGAASPAACGQRPAHQAQVHGPDQGRGPPTFVLFASRAEHLPDSYRRYLINSLRESFDLPGVPIRVSIRANKNPYAEGGDQAGPAPGSAYTKPRRRAGPSKPAGKPASGKPASGKAASGKPPSGKPPKARTAAAPKKVSAPKSGRRPSAGAAAPRRPSRPKPR